MHKLFCSRCELEHTEIGTESEEPAQPLIVQNVLTAGAFNGVGGKTSPLEHRKESPPLKSEALKAPPSFKMLGEKGPMRPPPSRPPPTRSVKVLVPAEAYSVADLQAATNSFAQENLIGEGSLGRVYRGEFPDGQVIVLLPRIIKNGYYKYQPVFVLVCQICKAALVLLGRCRDGIRTEGVCKVMSTR